MTVAAAMRNRDRLPPGTIARGLLAGSAWGLTMGVGLPLLWFLDCGSICLSDVALTTAISAIAGIAVIGPLAALRRASVGAIA